MRIALTSLYFSFIVSCSAAAATAAAAGDDATAALRFHRAATSANVCCCAGRCRRHADIRTLRTAATAAVRTATVPFSATASAIRAVATAGQSDAAMILRSHLGAIPLPCTRFPLSRSLRNPLSSRSSHALLRLSFRPPQFYCVTFERSCCAVAAELYVDKVRGCCGDACCVALKPLLLVSIVLFVHLRESRMSTLQLLACWCADVVAAPQAGSFILSIPSRCVVEVECLFDFVFAMDGRGRVQRRRKSSKQEGETQREKGKGRRHCSVYCDAV